MEYHGKDKSLKLIFTSLILIMVFIIGFIIFLNSNSERSLYTISDFFMDTTVIIKVKDKPGTRAVAENTLKKMKIWSQRLDRHNSWSIISQINNSGGKPVQVSNRVFSLLMIARKYFKLSDRAFDPTVTPLIELWGFGEEKQRVPGPKEIKRALKLVDYSKISFVSKNNLIILPSRMSLDLGALAKGFVVDQGIEILKEAGIKSAYINAGGNIRVIGKKSPGHSWHLGIQKPRGKGIFRDYIFALNQGSLATSGDYERYFTVDGIRYSHLLDPRTGYQPREMQSVTIYAPQALTADILSTAVFVMGWKEGQKLIKNLSGIEGFMVKNDKIWVSHGFKDMLLK